jgi:hypothetical protein
MEGPRRFCFPRAVRRVLAASASNFALRNARSTDAEACFGMGFLPLFGEPRACGAFYFLAIQGAVQFGGICAIVTDKWTGRTEWSETDSKGLGRWSWIRLNGKNVRRITIITVCQVCKQSISTVRAKTARAQQWHSLRQSGDIDPNPQKAFCKDFDAFLTPLQTAGDELLVMGDPNEHLGDSTSGMSAVVAKFGLVDSTACHHGIENEVGTRSRSLNRLDCIPCSHGIASTIWRCGVLPLDVVFSDHRRFFLSLDIESLLGGDPSPLVAAALRGIRSTTPKDCVKHVTKLQEWGE